MNAVHTEALAKRFGRVTALAGLDLDVPEGAIYALVGPNGAGKTTAVKILMNIFAPSGGRAQVLGMDSTRIAGRDYTAIGYVSENQKLPEWMKVSAFFDYLRPFYPSWDRALEDQLVRQFDLPLDRKLKDLSRGMRMKAALAGALSFHPKMIVMDEPFTGLDPLVRDELIEGLLDRAIEATVFISSHDLAEVESFASHVGYLERGRLQFSEELTTLSARFRQVEITFAAPPQLPAKLPQSWMQAGTSASVVRFIEGRFDRERTESEIRGAFPDAEVRDVAFIPMSLREIFLAMAKTGTKTGRRA